VYCFPHPSLVAARVVLLWLWLWRGVLSFGTGSNHVREKDGLWAVLAWLAILAGATVSGCEAPRKSKQCVCLCPPVLVFLCVCVCVCV
jgi:hypothetical protein